MYSRIPRNNLELRMKSRKPSPNGPWENVTSKLLINKKSPFIVINNMRIMWLECSRRGIHNVLTKQIAAQPVQSVAVAALHTSQQPYHSDYESLPSSGNNHFCNEKVNECGTHFTWAGSVGFARFTHTRFIQLANSLKLNQINQVLNINNFQHRCYTRVSLSLS